MAAGNAAGCSLYLRYPKPTEGGLLIVFLGEGDVKLGLLRVPRELAAFIASNANAVLLGTYLGTVDATDEIRDCCPVNGTLNKQVPGMASLGKVSLD